jgi:16S rRNA (adenine1518-N6/adenine1519-N6)-dimethyltransferase
VTAPADPLAELDATHLGPEAVERYLRRYGLAPQRRLGQNHLVDGEVLESIVAAAEIRPGARVLEIGPGIGVLTAALLRAGAAVTAVEVDPRLAAHLRERFGGVEGLRLVEGDVLDVPLEALVAPPWQLVANLPYQITSPVLHRVLDAEPRPTGFVLMLQREVAERVAAPPGAMSYLSVFVQYHANVRVLRIVPASAFEPAPEVESAVLVGRTVPRLLDPAGESDLWRLVQAAFRERRKMLHNVLPRQLPAVGRQRFEAALARAAIAPDRRPQTLGVDEWLALAGALGVLEAPSDPTP